MLRPNSPLIDRRILDIDARYVAFLSGGVPLADYPGETLQCRNELDRTNWMELRDLCRQAIEAEKAYYAANELPDPVDGWGAGLITAPGIRTTSNAYIRPTVAATLAILATITAWAFEAQANWWRMKDEARAATNRQDLEAIDLEQGWP